MKDNRLLQPKRQEKSWWQRGFTLIEVVAVVAIIGISLPIVFSILTTIVEQQGKVYRLTEAKQQGDFVSAYLKAYLRRNGEAIYGSYVDGVFTGGICDPEDGISTFATQSGKDFYFQNRYRPNSFFRFYNERVTIETGELGQTREISQIMFDEDGSIHPLTTNNVKVENFSIECFRKNSYGGPFVKISYLIYFTGNSDSFDINTAPPEELAVLNYRLVVQLLD